MATLNVRVTPRAGRDQVSGARTGADGTREVCVRVTAPPEGGKANKAVAKLVAQKLGIAKTKVCVARGATGRSKTLSIDAPQDVVDAWAAGLPKA